MLVSLRRVAVLIIFSLFLFFFTQEVSAGGQKEDRLPEAQKLIDEGKYNDAILVLTDVMKTNPDQFTEAQKMIREIKEARDNYNSLYAQLIKVLDPPRGEAIDEDLAYSLIREMEALDKTPNKAAVAAFAQARDTIVFAVTNRTFENIMDECTILLGDKKYIEAVDKYLSGFVLHREFFVKKDYGNIVLDQIDSDIADIKSYTDQFKSLLPLIDDKAAVISNAAFSDSLSDLESNIKDYRDLLILALNLKRNIVRTALHLDGIRASIQREDESDIPYLSTLRVLSKGRVKAADPEGLAGSIERYWSDTVAKSAGELRLLLEDKYKKALDSYDQGNYETGIQDSSLVLRYADVLLTLQNLWGGLVDIDSYGNPTAKGWRIINNQLPSIIKTREEVSEALRLEALDTKRLQVLSVIAKVGELNDPATIEDERQALLDIRTGIEKDMDITAGQKSRLEKIRAAGIDTGVSVAIADEILKREDSFHAETMDVEIDFAEKIVKLQIDKLADIIAEHKSRSEQAKSLTEGVKEKIGGIEYLVKKPDIAASIILESRSVLKKAETDLEGITELISSYDKYIRDSEALGIQLKRIEDLKGIVAAVYTSMNSTAVKAKDLNDKADDLYNLGYLRLDETYARFDRGNFDVARNKYYEAETALQKSLEFREDKAVRKLLTEEMPSLYDRIMVALNKQIIKEVRALINRGKDYYNVEKFIRAEQTFQQAKERYKVTHEELNPEIENWLVKVKKALEATSGRVIVPTDPLYPEMIHILNIAEEDFTKGRELLESGNKEEASRLFEDAVKNIEYVKETFPRNFKASVMYLKILEYTEKETFANYFKSMFESAVAKIKTDPKSADDDLLALSAVDPDYPGIKSALYKSGIAAGRLTPPPAKVDIAKARDLYYKAKRIADADNRAQFPIAIAYLEESLQIDSNFNSAAVLLDQLRTSTGIAVSSVMSDADQQKLRFAENLYIEGKYLEASIIISQLWSNPENRKSAKLNDLKKKVDARL